MTSVGTVAELWRFPVKSMQGERVDTLDIAPGTNGSQTESRWPPRASTVAVTSRGGRATLRNFEVVG